MFGSGGCLSYFARAASEKVFPRVQFVNKYLPEERSKIPQTEEQLSSLLIFSKETTLTVTLLDCQSHFVMENT